MRGPPAADVAGLGRGARPLPRRAAGHPRAARLPARDGRRRPGDGILLHTDGLAEARRGQEPLGVERVPALLRELDGPAPAEVVEVVSEEARDRTGGTLQDDLCLIALRVT